MRPRWQFLSLTAVVMIAVTGCPSLQGPTLSVTPSVIDFGATATIETLLIRNTGGGALSWEVIEDIPWLSVDVATGVTPAGASDAVRVSVSRANLEPGDRSGVFTVRSTDGTLVRTIPVAMRVAGTPSMGVSPASLRVTLAPDAATGTGQITISNTGADPLTWSLTPRDPANAAATFPYLSFSPATTGVINPGQAPQVVVVTVTASELESDQVSILLDVLNVEADVRQSIALEIEVGASTQGAAIGVSATTLDFGAQNNELTFDVYNAGQAGSLLEFTVTAEPSGLLTVTPTTGSSEGTGDPQQVNVNRVPVTVRLDRTQMPVVPAGGVVQVSAAGLDSVQIAVDYERAGLIIEGAQNRARPPYVLRFVFLLRDSTGAVIDTLDPVVFEELQTAFRIEENGVPLDTNETNLFITRADRLTCNLAILLDYTGSMYAAIEALFPQSSNALQELYAGKTTDEGIIGAFVRSLPGNYGVSIMEYHERQQRNRLIHGFGPESDRDAMIQALKDFSLPRAEHGASEIHDAIIDACTRIEDEDAGRLSFYDTDVRALVFISDGRDTSSVATAEDAINYAKERRIRLYPIGFGQQVNGEVLRKMATDTGGHYYPAATVSELRNLLQRRTGASSGGGLIAEELRRQVFLTYITLDQQGSGTYAIRGSFRGDEGTFGQDAVVIPGDVRAGQLALLSTEVDPADNTAEVLLRADYVPRNISQIRFRVWTSPLTAGAPTPAMQVTRVADLQGGLVADWSLLEDTVGPNPIPESRVFTVLTTEDNPLPYGTSGQLLLFTFTGVPAEGFRFNFRVDNRIYVDPPVTKFFQHPETIPVGAAPYFAGIIPLMVEDGFDPDAPDAWNRDGDPADDFDDRFPDDDANQ